MVLLGFGRASRDVGGPILPLPCLLRLLAIPKLAALSSQFLFQLVLFNVGQLMRRIISA